MEIKVREISKKVVSTTSANVEVFKVTAAVGDRVASTVIRHGSGHLSGHCEVSDPTQGVQCVWTRTIGGDMTPEQASDELLYSMVHWLNGEPLKDLQEGLFTVEPKNLDEYRAAFRQFMGI